MTDVRKDFLSKISQRDASNVVVAFEALNDAQQAEVEINLIRIRSKTWPETFLWEHIEKNGLRVDRTDA